LADGNRLPDTSHELECSVYDSQRPRIKSSGKAGLEISLGECQSAFFFQYILNLQHRLGVDDAYMFEDYDLIASLSGSEPSQPSQRDVDQDARLSSSSADLNRRGQTARRQRPRTPAQQAAAERRVKIEAARLRWELDKHLGRETPQWVIELAQDKPQRP
jgi:hypothetical protein